MRERELVMPLMEVEMWNHEITVRGLLTWRSGEVIGRGRRA